MALTSHLISQCHFMHVDVVSFIIVTISFVIVSIIIFFTNIVVIVSIRGAVTPDGQIWC